METPVVMRAPALVQPKIEYPESDGKPMGETDSHVSAILYLLGALRQFFRRVEQIYVAADMFVYFEEGNPSAFVVPDVFIVKGVAKGLRRTFKLWEERAAPCVVFEITSRSSRLEDLGTKRALYEDLGVREYFLFDPLEEYLSQQLQGFRLSQGYYQPMPLRPDGTLQSDELGLILRPEESFLRLVDPTNDAPLLALDEAMDRAHTEAQRAQSEAQRAQFEAQRAQSEAQRADRAEAEIARLRAELARQRGK